MTLWAPHPAAIQPTSSARASPRNPRRTRLISEALPVGFHDEYFAGLASARVLVAHGPQVETGGACLALTRDQVPAEGRARQDRLNAGPAREDAARVAAVIGASIELGAVDAIPGEREALDGAPARKIGQPCMVVARLRTAIPGSLDSIRVGEPRHAPATLSGCRTGHDHRLVLSEAALERLDVRIAGVVRRNRGEVFEAVAQ